jgi:hypothetical protein
MKINEIHLDEHSLLPGGIRTILLNKGYIFLGKGVDQSAYLDSKTGLVLKIFGTQKELISKRGKPKFSNDQQMFFKWAKFCMKNQTNPFLPKFYEFESFIHNDRTYLQIRQERLLDSGNLGLLIADAGTTLAISSNKLTNNTASLSLKKLSPKEYKRLLNNLGPKNLQILLITLLSLFRLGKRQGWYWDLHASNIMKRKDGTPVIVDPWVVE